MAPSALWCVISAAHFARSCFDDAAAHCEQAFQINDSVVCATAEQAHNPRHLQTRKCLGGHAERLIRMEGWVVVVLFFFAFACYRVRAPSRRVLTTAHLRARRASSRHQGFFYSCHRIKLSLKASGAVHPMRNAAEAVEAEEGVHKVEAPALKGRPRGRAAQGSTLQVLSVQATAVPASDA